MGLHDAYVNTGNVEEFSEYIIKLKKANPGSDAMESIEFETNKNLYFIWKYQKAIKCFEEYLKNYPDNTSKLDAKYYLGDSYYQVGYRAKALEMLLNVVKEAKEMNGAEAQYLIAEMLYWQGKFNESLAACHAFNNQLASFTKRYNKTCRLLTGNYLGLKQTYLAHATLKSIIDNAKDNQTRK